MTPKHTAHEVHTHQDSVLHNVHFQRAFHDFYGKIMKKYPQRLQRKTPKQTKTPNSANHALKSWLRLRCVHRVSKGAARHTKYAL